MLRLKELATMAMLVQPMMFVRRELAREHWLSVKTMKTPVPKRVFVTPTQVSVTTQLLLMTLPVMMETLVQMLMCVPRELVFPERTLFVTIRTHVRMTPATR
jgi:hypothetical protein